MVKIKHIQIQNFNYINTMPPKMQLQIVPAKLTPLWVLFICVTLNIATVFFCYRMVDDTRSDLEKFIFEHKNNPTAHHPLSLKNSARIDFLEKRIELNHKQ